MADDPWLLLRLRENISSTGFFLARSLETEAAPHYITGAYAPASGAGSAGRRRVQQMERIGTYLRAT